MAKKLIRKQALDEFGKLYVKTLRDELLNTKPFPKRASGRLVDSINYKLINTPEGTNLQLLAENYLTFVDKGVSGTEKKYNTPYSYRTKYPPIQEIRTLSQDRLMMYLNASWVFQSVEYTLSGTAL